MILRLAPDACLAVPCGCLRPWGALPCAGDGWRADRLRGRGPARRARRASARRAPGAAATSSPAKACRWPICAAAPPPGSLMFLPADRVIVGDASATPPPRSPSRAASSESFLIAARRAMGLPIPDQDEAVYTDCRARVGADDPRRPRRRASPTRTMLDLLRVLGRGLSQVAETLRALPLKLVLEPGISEPELAKPLRAGRRRALSARRPARRAACSRCTCATPRRATVVSAIERSGGQLPGSREIARLLRRPRRLHAPRRGSRRRTSSAGSPCAWKRSPATSPSRPCGSSRRSATPRCSPRPSPSRCSSAALA